MTVERNSGMEKERTRAHTARKIDADKLKCNSEMGREGMCAYCTVRAE